MGDPSVVSDAAFTALLARLSDADRLRLACGMFDAAKTLAAADISARHPEIGPSELRAQLFDRLYLGEFDVRTRDHIVKALSAPPTT